MPLHASMPYLLPGAGFLITPLSIFAIALALFIAGAEIRVRIEERLLSSRCGDAHQTYRRSTPAYLPLIKFPTAKPTVDPA